MTVTATAVGATTVAVSSPSGAAPALPTITSLSSHSGVWWGGLQITVRGTNFTGVQKVTFAQSSGWDVTVVSPTLLTVRTPDHANGLTHVRVTTAAGQSRRSDATKYTFTSPTMDTPIYGGLTARQEQRISWQVRQKHRPARIAPKAKAWTRAMGLTAIHRAQSWLGLPYSWAGGSPKAPTYGVCSRNGGDNDCRVIGFDCSGLTLHSWGPYRTLDHYAQTQKGQAGRFHPTVGQLVPGDLVFFSSYIPDGIGHTAIYEGRGWVIEAGQSGTLVRRSRLADLIKWDGEYRGAVRPMSTGKQAAGPVITSATKTVPAAGGRVTLTGRNLSDVTAVTVGTSRVYTFVQRTATKLVVNVPARAAGRTTLIVSNPWGNSRTLALGYTGRTVTAHRAQTSPGTLPPVGMRHTGNRAATPAR
ncbi:IPT/TIG domain-containing protein [Jatrophihabitans fulvus]